MCEYRMSGDVASNVVFKKQLCIARAEDARIFANRVLTLDCNCINSYPSNTTAMSSSQYLKTRMAACPGIVNQAAARQCRPTIDVQTKRLHVHDAHQSNKRLSASTLTSRLQDRATRTERFAEFFPPPPTPAPCPPPQIPQPGVPIAPQTPCNPGDQRVDYTSPYA